MHLTLKIDGIQNIQHDLGLIVDRGKISRTLEQAADLVTGVAQVYCPVETTRLQESITPKKVDDLTWEIRATASYADYVEFGTYKMIAGSPENPYIYKGPSRVGKYPSYRPFLRSALWDCQQRIIDMFNQVLNEQQQ